MTKDLPDTLTFSALAMQLIAGGRRIRFQAHGNSMLPSISDGEFLYVEEAKPKDLKSGDIVLFQCQGEFKAHRIVRARDGRFLTRGDAAIEGDGEITGDQIVGKVIAKECGRTGRMVLLQGINARANFLWRKVRGKLAATVRSFAQLRPLAFAVFTMLLAVASANAQITVDHSNSRAQLVTANAGPVTLNPVSLTVSTGANRLLVVGVSFNTSGNSGTTVSGITYGAQSFVAANSLFVDPGNGFRVEIWYLIAPNTGTNNITVTVNKTGGNGNKLGVVIGVIDFNGVYQASPIRGLASSSGASTTPQVVISSATPQMVLDAIASPAGVTVTVPAAQTGRWNLASSGIPTGQNGNGAGSSRPGATSVTMSETLNASSAWTDAAIAITPPGADLSITKSGSPNPVLKNGTLTYTLTVTNNGPQQATGVIVADTLPSQVSFVSATSSQGSCTQFAGLVTCNVGTMNDLATVTITIVTTAVTPSEATNTAVVSAATTDPDLTNNTASVTTLIEFPTAVNINSVSASPMSGGVLVSWKSGGEVHNLGFNVYRDSGDGKVRLNSSLIAGSALLMRETLEQHGARSYVWIDRSGVAASYWLEDVDLNGTRTMHGPISMESVVSPQPMANARTFQDLAAATSTVADPTIAATHVRETVARPQTSATSSNLGFALAARQAVKIVVDHEGWYHVTQPQLVAAGFSPSADSKSLHLFAEGLEQPIRITSEPFGAQSAIEFYGTGIDTPYSGQRIYWLVSEPQPGLRIRDISTADGPGPQPQTFIQTIELKPRTTYFAALLREDTDNFFGPLVSPTPESESFNVSNIVPGDGRLQITLQGVTQGQQHDVTVMLNGATLGDVTFAGQGQGAGDFIIPSGALINGANAITLTAQQGTGDISLVDTIDVSFPHTFTASADSLKFTANAGESVTVTGFAHQPSRLIDITNALQPLELGFETVTQNSGFALQATIPWTTAGQHALIALSDAQLASPVALVPNQPSHLHDSQTGASMVILTVPQFGTALQPIVGFHQKQGISTALVSVDDIYDEFNFGERSPSAIRAFLQFATGAWKNKPKYLLLAGDASVDPRNYLGFGLLDFVPTRIVPTAMLKTASDDWFSDFGNTGIAAIATGRMPGRTPDDMKAMVAKTLNYESSSPASWNAKALLVADEDPSLSFTSAAQSVQNLLPQSISSTDVFVDTLGSTTAHTNLLDAINGGQLLVNYNGHGSVALWGSGLLNTDDASELTNGDQLPLFVIMNCLNGFFHDVTMESMATALMLSPKGGAAAVWASSGLT
ncbi:MAG TPA: C25 family cysteine peptidase, partial [Terriglobales bacterium]|nr:C25 family cysteine peptidase [Terriglobales bacterium]